MSYTPTNWANGKAPAINADNLNKIENELVKLDNLASVLDITETTETTMPNSYSGRLLVEEIGGGESQQNTTSGKNLLDCSGLTEKTVQGITFTPVYENGMLQYINVNGTATANADYTIKYMDFVANTEYAINGCPSGGSSVTYFFAINGTTSTKFDLGSGNAFTFDSEKNTNALIRIRANVTASNLKFYPMVRLASVTDATYEPYTGGIPAPNPSYPQEIKKTVVSEIRTRGKNLLNVELVDGTTAGITYKLNADKSITVSGTRTSSVYRRVGGAYLKAGKYIYDVAKGSFENMQGLVGKPDGTTLTKLFPYILEITEENEGWYEFGLKGITDGMACSGTGYLQVEKGETLTAYEPYTESVITLSQPIELYGKGDVQDVIKDGKVKRRFKKIILSADEGWKLNSSGNAYYYATNDGSVKSNAIIVSSHFIRSKWSVMGKDTICLGNGTNSTLGISSESFDSVESLKTFLSNNTVEAIIELADEVIEELPIADQIALNSLPTIDGITYLEFDSEIEPTFKGEYGTSKVGGYTLEGMLAGRNGELYGKTFADRITALETTVVNNI